MSDYAPVKYYDDEDELLRNGGYAPAAPPSPDAAPDAPPPVASASPMPAVAPASSSLYPAPAPAVGSLDDLEARAGQPRMAPVRTPEAPRPQWKDYAPPEPHGWSRLGHSLAAISPITNSIFNKMPEQRAEANYKNATSEYDAPLAEQHTEAETEHAQSQSELEHEQAEILRRTGGQKQGLTPEETTIHDLMAGENGGPRINPQTNKPYSYLEAYGAVQNAKAEAKPDKTKNAEDQFVEEYQKTHPKATVAQAQHAFKQNETVAEPGNFMPLYDEKGHVSGAWDPKSGRIVKTPEGALPGNTSQGSAMAEKSDERNATATATVNSFTRYQQSFHDLSPQLTPQDREAMQVLTSHQEKIAEGFLGAAQSGVLDTLIGQPLTGYSQKLMGGAMTKDQYDKLSPAGKKMLADYFNAVVQNFGNMKQIMGSVGRNPIQLLAEINTIPLPYLDAQSAETMFKDKLDDLHQRNPNLAKSESAAKGGAKEAPEGTRIQVGDKTQVKRNGRWVPEQP